MNRTNAIKVAARAGVDPRTVQRAVSGEWLRSAATREAIAAALEAEGFHAEALEVRGQLTFTKKEEKATP